MSSLCIYTSVFKRQVQRKSIIHERNGTGLLHRQLLSSIHGKNRDQKAEHRTHYSSTRSNFKQQGSPNGRAYLEELETLL